MFYDEFVKMCNLKNVSRTKACIDCGVSRTAWHKWECGATPNGATLNRLADYFGVTTDYLLTGLPANIYECPNDENPWEVELLDAFDQLDVDRQIEAVEHVQNMVAFPGNPDDENKKAPTNSGERKMSDAELKFALWGDCEDVSDEDLADVRRYAAFVRERKKDRK